MKRFAFQIRSFLVLALLILFQLGKTCPDGYYSSGSCVACPNGMTNNGAVNTQSCNHVYSCCFCSENYYSNSATSHLCAACPAGSTTAGVGYSACTCVAGRYFTSTACVECATDGTTSAASTTDNKVTSCTACAANMYSNTATGHVCTACPTGTTSGAGSTGLAACICAAGNYFNNGGSCVPCTSGTTAAASNGIATVSSCTACPSGQQSNSANSHICTDCPVGTYNQASLGLGQTTCYTCPAGSTNSGTRNTRCNCAAGRFFDSSSSGACVVCAGGTSAVASDTDSPVVACTVCSPGYESNSDTGHLCTACVVGKYAAAWGQAKCADCPAPTFNTAIASTYCTCAAGRYFDSTGACVPCTDGTMSVVSTTSSHGSCYDCEPGQVSDYIHALCVYTYNCALLCSDTCTHQFDLDSCVAGCVPTALASYMGNYIYGCHCPYGTAYFNRSCVPTLTEDCYPLCGKKGCIRAQDQVACIDCAAKANVLSLEIVYNGTRGYFNCSCENGAELMGDLCGYTEECHLYCENCVLQASASACIGCKAGLTLTQNADEGVTCSCPNGTAYYSNATCLPVLSTGCHALCGGTCLSPNNSTMCLNSCKSGPNIVTTALFDEVTSCSCIGGTKLNSLGDCVLDMDCDPLCINCADIDSCIQCPQREGMILSAGKCMCSIEDDYVLTKDHDSGEHSCVKKSCIGTSAAKYSAYMDPQINMAE